MKSTTPKACATILSHISINQAACFALVVFLFLTLSTLARSAVLNIDINAYASDSVYSGADGVLSSAGSYWNWMPRDAGRYNLKDELGTQTAVTITSPGGSYYVNLDYNVPTNSPQRSAMECLSGTYLYVSNLTASATYDIAVYLSSWSTRIWVEGTSKTSDWNGVTGNMPGTENRDYMLFTNVSASAAGSITVYVYPTSGSYNGVIAGMQIRGSFPVPEEPLISVEPKYLNFPSVPVGTSTNLSFTVKNEGVGTLSGSASISLPASYSILSGSPYTLAPGTSQSVTVRFSPSSVGNTYPKTTFTGGGGTTRSVYGNAVVITNTYTVTFDAQSGSIPNPTSITVTNGSTYGTLPTTTRTGYTFAGWWTNTLGTGTQVTSATTVTITNAQTLYAKWTLTTTTHGTAWLWLDQYGLVSGGNYEAADALDTDGDGYTAWQEYIAGTVPTNRASVFRALVTISNGSPRVAWTPDLGTGRVYTVEGRTNLTVGVWGATNAGSRYFRVKVGMP